MPDTPSPKHGLVRPADTDFINAWPSQVRSIVDYLDPRIATIITGAPRPAAGVVGRFHKADDGTLTFDDGTNWVELPNVPLQSADIGDAQVTNAKLGDDAVDAAKIAAGAVGQSELADGAVNSAKIQDATIVAGDLAASVADPAGIGSTRRGTAYDPAQRSIGYTATGFADPGGLSLPLTIPSPGALVVAAFEFYAYIPNNPSGVGGVPQMTPAWNGSYDQTEAKSNQASNAWAWGHGVAARYAGAGALTMALYGQCGISGTAAYFQYRRLTAVAFGI